MKVIIREYEYESEKLIKESYVDELTLFVWDECHRIYLVENQNDIESVKQTWGDDTIFYNIDKLPKIWYKSCPLRFVYNWSGTKRYVEQGNYADFEFID